MTEKAENSPPLLEIRDLTVRYGPVMALQNMNMEIRKGEAIALIGANGAGKSTLLRAISGLVRPSGGDIIYAGQSIKSRSPEMIVRSGIAHSPEGRRLFGNLTVSDNLRLGACTRSNPADVARDIEYVESVFPIIAERRKQLAGTLSGGEQQMVALGRALMSSPQILMMDEPSLGVAPLVVKNIFEQLTRMREKGTTILVVEQNMHLALNFASRAYVMRTGRLVLQGRAADLANDPRVVQAYLGEAQ